MGLKRLQNAALLLLCLLLCAACGGDDAAIEPAPTPAVARYYLTVEAGKTANVPTRALAEDERQLTSTWATTEQVFVSKGGTWCEGALQPESAGATALLSGNISIAGSTIAAGDALTLRFPRKEVDYTGQKGTLPDIATRYDYAEATATVTSVNKEGKIAASPVTFTNQQAIVKFVLKDPDGNDINATSLTIAATGLQATDAETGSITVTPAAATNELYVALSGVSSTGIDLCAKAGDDIYIYHRANVTFTHGKYYVVNVKMQPDNVRYHLTLQAVSDGTTVTFYNNAAKAVEYSTDLEEWSEIGSGNYKNINLDAGQRLRFRGTNTTYCPGSYASTITCDKDCYIYGNIMSLISDTGFESSTSLNDDYGHTFQEMFQNQKNLINHPVFDLMLPATELANYCYHNMFQGCSRLTRAPVLPARELVNYCYQGMFQGCTSLNYVKCLATKITANYCTEDWLNGVSESGTFVKASGTKWGTGDSGIPSSWKTEEIAVTE